MKLRYFLSIGIALALSHTAMAKGAEKKEDEKKPNEQPMLAAGCIPANAIIFLEYNNVRTRVEAGGLWWQDRANRNADYEVPKGSNSYALYAGGLWLAGTDVNGQLKAAVSLFGTGTDYYSGPLNNDGTAEIDNDRCERWDRFFQISRVDVEEFVLYNTSDEQTRAELFPDGYETPESIRNWPANGLPNTDSATQALLAPKLAPYIDVNGDGFYDWRDGDYPFYDLGASLNTNVTDSSLINSDGIVDCRAPRVDRSESAGRPLFGDRTYWWIFNDKGNLHTESNAPSIGMEIHGQAFAFATNDEVNDMTFYNFELINRSTFTLTDTYFASYVDPDLGFPSDDYVGCDVERGFGFCYNGDEEDDDFQGQTGYGTTPACIGIDFFEGPYQDADGINNNVGIRPGEALNGLGYFDPTDQEPDTIIDNERFGMRRFVYYNIGGGPNGDPQLAIHYYNYMRGIWQNNQRMSHGGNGLNSAGVEDIPTAFMFPGESDPLYWGLVNEAGVVEELPTNRNWTEDRPGGGEDRNDPGDRRFLQSAGPFTLEPGNVNDITVGVVFGQAESGGRLASVDVAFTADNKAQALFDNCFQVLDGPDAPDMEIQELDQELIFYLTNSELSNNFNEEYAEEDPNIITPDTMLNLTPPGFYNNEYRFQGYQVFQLSGPDVSVNDIYDPSLSRLVFQCDIRDNDTTLVNFVFDEQLQANFPQVMVEGANEGIQHSFRVTEDLFAEGNTRLVNYRTYYYLAIAYATNNFRLYVQDRAPEPAYREEDANGVRNGRLIIPPGSDGQKTPYLASRQKANGNSIEAQTAIPHRTVYEAGGTVVNSRYGDIVGVTRWQGTGNGGNALEFTEGTLNRLWADKDWENEELPVRLDYKLGLSPIAVKVVDPLNVIDASFVFKMNNENGATEIQDSTTWFIANRTSGDTLKADRRITSRNEQLLKSGPINWGLSVDIGQVEVMGDGDVENNGFINATSTVLGNGTNWLGGIPDSDGETPFNWILAGNVPGDGQANYGDRRIAGTSNPPIYIDPTAAYEGVLGGTWAPYNLVGYGRNLWPGKPGQSLNAVEGAKLRYLNSTVVVFTPDKSKWTRSPIVESQEDPLRSVDGTPWMRPRVNSLSVDKDGVPFDTTGTGIDLSQRIETIMDSLGSDNPDDANFISPVGMGWFPGYAFNLETGERLNIAFAEDTWQGDDNGDDMLWNPTTTFASGTNFENVWGGKHYTYIFRSTSDEEAAEEGLDQQEFPNVGLYYRVPPFDNGKKILAMMNSGLAVSRESAWRAVNWMTIPMLNFGTQLLSSEIRVNLQVSKPYDIAETRLFTDTVAVETTITAPVPPNTQPDTTITVEYDSALKFLFNEGRPSYTFVTDGFAVELGNTTALEDALVDINVVPNPYYAVSEYEMSALDNIVKITNLPQFATINIYNMSGTLIRSYNKADPANFLDWDLTNQAGIPISSGVYIIHIEVPNVGEKVLKWFGVTRPVDLENF